VEDGGNAADCPLCVSGVFEVADYHLDVASVGQVVESAPAFRPSDVKLNVCQGHS